MHSILFEILIILSLVTLNGLFAMAEIAIVSARKARLEEMAGKGDKAAAAALELVVAPNRFLSTTQIGITLVGICSGAFGGATLAESIARWVGTNAAFAPYSDLIGLGLVVILISVLSLVFGELVPKRVGMSNPEQIARYSARPLRWLEILAAPVVRFLSGATELALTLLPIDSRSDRTVTETDIKGLIRQGTAVGLYDATEQDLMERVMYLGDRTVGSVMTPRVKVVWLDTADEPAVNQAKVLKYGHTRYPVSRDNLDNIIGMVHVKDLLRQQMEKRRMEVTGKGKDILFLPENMEIPEALEKFRRAKESMAVVVDEYGSVAGILTLTDVLGAIVGDLPNQAPGGRVRSRQREDGSWLVDGLLPIEALEEITATDLLDDDLTGRFRTVAGLVLFVLGRIPEEADNFVWNGWKFEVIDMDGHRVDKVVVTRVTAAAADSAPVD